MTLFPDIPPPDPEKKYRRTRDGAWSINPCLLFYGPGPLKRRCKHCARLTIKRMGRKFFKCSLRVDTNGPGSDHRANWPTCAQFKEA